MPLFTGISVKRLLKCFVASFKMMIVNKYTLAFTCLCKVPIKADKHVAPSIYHTDSKCVILLFNSSLVCS